MAEWPVSRRDALAFGVVSLGARENKHSGGVEKIRFCMGPTS
jgi:hypothetical protein